MDPNDELPPSERARDRRRDRDAAAKERAGMRTGLAKQFKQVMDAQRRRGEDAARLLERSRGESDFPGDDELGSDEARRHEHGHRHDPGRHHEAGDPDLDTPRRHRRGPDD